MTYRLATPADRPAIIALLEQVDLLTDDLPDDLGTFALALYNETLAGAAGIDRVGQLALLRSVAVSPHFRNQGIANQLVSSTLKLAEERGITVVYLLTTTAATYFERLGFSRVDRSNVPEAIAQTRQFSNLCPASAVVMVSRLKRSAAAAPVSELN